ncbi:IclR family transcriptional regulator [Arcobacter arenosus]|uniref:IclR family transcriptional regulator n=1 Tax=Arcobacter arenosus TaxID=2576037 RepID=A0A5R8Y0A0_9BACT|nr:IclR family transcriptional regulator [Arcobacter arenosus]TLP37728.1 IclR family transcriptional regulator [Arcobacter arenosus]
MNKSSNLSSVENALKILECFTVDDTEKRVTEISNELGLAKSTVSRLLKTLLNQGYVKKNLENQKYSLGNKVLTLYSALMSNMEIVKEAHPFLEELAKDTSESVQLAELDKNKVIYMEQIKSSFPIQIFAHIGRVNPVHCTSSGKLLLAYKDFHTIENILSKGLEKYTKYTITDEDKLKKELLEIRDLGYCYIENEFIDGIVSIAAPIRDYNKNVIAAVSLVGPIQRINGVKAQKYIGKVVETAKKISSSMGYMY